MYYSIKYYVSEQPKLELIQNQQHYETKYSRSGSRTDIDATSVPALVLFLVGLQVAGLSFFLFRVEGRKLDIIYL